MLDYFLEQNLCTLTEVDVTLAEDVGEALQPLKAASPVMSEKKSLTHHCAPACTAAAGDEMRIPQ